MSVKYDDYGNEYDDREKDEWDNKTERKSDTGNGHSQCRNCGAEAYGSDFCSSYCRGNIFYKREDYP